MSGHTPYRQWVVYRKRRLLIGTSRADAPTYDLGRQVADSLATHLPESRARTSRAPDPWRLASLISSGQLDVGILSAGDALALMEGRPPFTDFGGVPLRALFTLGDYLLVARAEFPAHHAYLVSQTLDEHGLAAAGGGLAGMAGKAVPIHPGTLAYARGLPQPEAAPAAMEAIFPARGD